MIRGRVINSAEFFRALRRIVTERDVANRTVFRGAEKSGRPRREAPGGKIHGAEASQYAFRNVFDGIKSPRMTNGKYRRLIVEHLVRTSFAKVNSRG